MSQDVNMVDFSGNCERISVCQTKNLKTTSALPWAAYSYRTQRWYFAESRKAAKSKAFKASVRAKEKSYAVGSA